MFTGIIESTAKVAAVVEEGSNLRVYVETDLLSELKVDQSVAHNGVCLTVEKINADNYEVVAVEETLQKTNLSVLQRGMLVNLERCMQMNGRLDGHIVQGHVDEVATVTKIEMRDGSWVFAFALKNPTKLMVEKGSICINGVSLTAFNVQEQGFEVTIIPYTYEHTTFQDLKEGDEVNLEFDILGKYVQRMMSR